MVPRIYSIPPGAPFFDTLAEAVLSGRLLPGFAATGDPLALAALTIYVPSRRAARALAGAFSAALGTGSAILPQIRVLAEPDEAGRLLAGGARDLAPVMDGLERRLHLARLVLAWKARLGEAASVVLDGEAIVLPASAADALYLSADLARLLDEAEDEGVALGNLGALPITERLAEWWQLSLGFLQILTAHWPDYLEERGLCGPAEARNRTARAHGDEHRAEPMRPVIVAGSTATAPQTVAFMRIVANLPMGALVLPGLDRTLDDESFAMIDRSRSIAAPGHPQHGLKRILNGLGVERAAVTDLDHSQHPAREAFLSDALRPAETSERWQDAAHPPEALADISLIEAADEREEALAIAVAMRAALETPDATVALSTPDRALARRVVAELARFGIEANDSAGRPLTATAPGTLTALALGVALEPGDPVQLLALLKHPLVTLGLSAAEARRGARAIELVALRGGTGTAGALSLHARYAERLAAFESDPRRRPRAVRLLSADDIALGETVAARLAEALEPLAGLAARPAHEIAEATGALARSLEALACDAGGNAGNLYARESGAALARLLAEMAAAPATGFAFPAREFPAIVEALASEIAVRPAYPVSRRAFVFGAIEARLQRVDTMVLGGLNEGTWPQRARNDAFLSRLMRAELLLDPPERRIGLAAHDFWMAMGTPRVILSRALREGGAPANASRWLQRVLTLAGPEGTVALRAAAQPFLDTARHLDDRPPVAPAERPEPAPPLDVRPDRLSFTEVERLVRDPYAVYARRVLKLEPFEDLVRDPAAAERGTLVHAIVAAFVDDGIDFADPQALDAMRAIAARHVEAETLPADVEAVWQPRIDALCRHVLEWERGRDVVERRTEVKADHTFPDIGMRLTGSADRIDRLADGTLAILDFKTGTQPSVKQARTLLAPQLPLEAGVAALGGFQGFAASATVGSLAYVRLRERELKEERLEKNATKTEPAVTASTLGDEAVARFRGLAGAYRDPAKGYLSRARPAFAGDFTGPYDHLARALEWAANGEAGDGDGESEA